MSDSRGWFQKFMCCGRKKSKKRAIKPDTGSKIYYPSNPRFLVQIPNFSDISP